MQLLLEKKDSQSRLSRQRSLGLSTCILICPLAILGTHTMCFQLIIRDVLHITFNIKNEISKQQSAIIYNYCLPFKLDLKQSAYYFVSLM